MNVTHLVLPALFSIGACGEGKDGTAESTPVSASTFSDLYVDAICATIERCYGEVFETEYDSSQPICLDKLGLSYGQTSCATEWTEVCYFEQDHAEDCIDALANVSCDDLMDPAMWSKQFDAGGAFWNQYSGVDYSGCIPTFSNAAFQESCAGVWDCSI